MKRMILNVIVLLVGILLGVLIAAGWRQRETVVAQTPLTTTAAGPTLESVQALASLVTTKVTISDVQLTELRGYVGGARAAMLVRGDFTLGTDLSLATFTQVDSEAKAVVITLKRPTAGDPRVDLARTKLIALTTSGLWEVVPSHEAKAVVVDEAYRQAQGILLRASQEPIWMDQAERQAERVITTFFTSFGWKAEVRWANG